MVEQKRKGSHQMRRKKWKEKLETGKEEGGA